MKSLGYTESGWSTGDIIKHWSTDNTSDRWQVITFLGGPVAAISSIHPDCCVGHVVRCVKVPQIWSQSNFFCLAEDQTRPLNFWTLQFPNNVQVVMIVSSWFLAVCVCECFGYSGRAKSDGRLFQRDSSWRQKYPQGKQDLLLKVEGGASQGPHRQYSGYYWRKWLRIESRGTR